MKKQLVAREQEITAVQARMQASYREHVKEVQQLQGKVGAVGGLGREGARWLPLLCWYSAFPVAQSGVQLTSISS